MRIQPLLRDLAPEVLGVMTRRYRDFAAAEDALQEALLAAATQWPKEGVPNSPRAWLIRAASRRFTDQVRSESARRRREELVVSLVPAEEQLVIGLGDDSLELLFMCCHPALTASSAIALTLRAIGGLTTAEIARAFFVPEATMAQRISRAKQTIASVEFETPGPDEIPSRLASVTHVLYLIFSEGYASGGAELVRTDLSGEALRLTRLLHRLAPDDPEVTGLLALMLLTDARRKARLGPKGELIPLDKQDRTLWDRDAIAEGIALIEKVLPRGQVGPYQLQSAIAAIHDEAKSTDETDWAQIVALYDVLRAMSDNPMVALNQAIAIAMVHGPAAGLERVDAAARDDRLKDHYRVDVVRAHLLERAGDRSKAIVFYRRAAERTTSTVERDFLLTHAAELAEA